MGIDGQGTGIRHRAGVARTVADVNLLAIPAPGVADEGTVGSGFLSAALDRVRQAVRGDDRICPYSVSHIAVEFGSKADAVAPRLLGQRLARAVGQGFLDHCAVPGARWGRRPATDADHRRGALSVNGPGPLRRTATIPSTTVVTVERIFDGPTALLLPDAGRRTTNGRTAADTSGMTPRLRQRAVVRYSAGGLAGGGTRHDDRARAPRPDEAVGTVLVLDPDPATGGKPGLASVAAADLAERIGFVAGAIALSSDDGLIAEIGGRPLDLVVMVVGSEPANEECNWSASTWSIPARLTEAYRAKGIGVLAVSAGASLAAMAGCIERGATAVFDPGTIREALLTHVAADAPGAVPDVERAGSGQVPRGAEGLLKLTGAERRVLFYLTTGRSPQGIADDLVVSLATVRSHIRSVLRKLGVRSQLAAVALATSRALAPDPAAPTEDAGLAAPADETVVA